MQTNSQIWPHVMTIGQTEKQWQEWKGAVERDLQNMHMGWSFCSEMSISVDGELSIGDVLSRIEKQSNLEIVFFSNENSPNKEVLHKNALTIAAALTEHKRKPWVILDFGLEYLKSLFEGHGIKTENSFLIAYTVHERWGAQVEAKAEVQ